jgi:hypothetical protein
MTEIEAILQVEFIEWNVISFTYNLICVLSISGGLIKKS